MIICEYCEKDVFEHRRFYFFAFNYYDAYGAIEDLKVISNNLNNYGICTRDRCYTLYVCDNKICDVETGKEIVPDAGR